MIEVNLVAETNFLIDIALKQDLNVLHLYDLAKNEELKIFVPEISFGEMFTAIEKKHKSRKRLATRIREAANRMADTPEHSSLVTLLRKCATELEASCEKDFTVVEHSLAELNRVIKVIPLTKDVLIEGFKIHIDARYGLEYADSYVYASIKLQIEQLEGKILFLQKDQHFNNRYILNELQEKKVKTFFSSGECINQFYKLQE